MKIFVAGASGTVGSALLPRLVEAGHTVTGMIRSREKEAHVRALGATPVVADGLDGAAVHAAMSQTAPDVVVHVMTALNGVQDYKNFDRSFEPTNRLRTIGTDNLLSAARAANVKRVVAHSYAGWNYAKEGDSAKRETDAIDPNPPKHQRETLQALVHLERTLLESGLPATVLRCANLYGPGSSIAPNGELVKVVRKRAMPIVGDGAGVWSFIHVDDAAIATVRAIDLEADGIFNIADDEPAPASLWLPELARILGAPQPFRVPVFIGRLAAGEAVVSMMTQARGASNAKAREVLSWRPGQATWREGFRTATALA